MKNKINTMIQQMKTQMDNIKSELENEEIIVSSGGGMIKITINGQQKIKQIKIEKEVINSEDSETLEDLILTAVNESIRKSNEISEKKMSKLTGGINLPSDLLKGLI